MTDTTQNKPTCCNECFDEGVSQLSYGGCRNAACKCHTTQTTPSEEWEIDAYHHLHVFAGLEEQGAPKKQIDIAQKEYIDFIRETRTAAYEKGVRDSLEALPKEEEPSKRLNTFKEGFKAGWNLYSEHSVRAISTLLT